MAHLFSRSAAQNPQPVEAAIYEGSPLAQGLIMSLYNCQRDYCAQPMNYAPRSCATIGTKTELSPAIGRIGSVPSVAPVFDGSQDYAAIRLNASAYNFLSFSVWLWFDNYNNSNNRLAIEHSPSVVNHSGFFFQPNDPTGIVTIGVTQDNNSNYYLQKVDRPTANAWHHWAWWLPHYGVPEKIMVWVDGIEQPDHGLSSGGVIGNFTDDTLYFASRAGSSQFMPMRMAYFNIWNRKLTDEEFVSLYQFPTILLRPPMGYRTGDVAAVTGRHHRIVYTAT